MLGCVKGANIVKRIVANFAAADVSRARQSYSEVLGLTR
jgi:hypothetical protein